MRKLVLRYFKVQIRNYFPAIFQHLCHYLQFGKKIFLYQAQEKIIAPMLIHAARFQCDIGLQFLNHLREICRGQGLRSV